MSFTITQLNEMSEKEVLDATSGLDEHPSGYDGICGCDLCLTYDGEEE